MIAKFWKKFLKALKATVSKSFESLKQRSVMGPAQDPSKTRVEKRMPSRGEDTQGRGKKQKGASSAKRKEMSMRSPSPDETKRLKCLCTLRF